MLNARESQCEATCHLYRDEPQDLINLREDARITVLEASWKKQRAGCVAQAEELNAQSSVLERITVYEHDKLSSAGSRHQSFQLLQRWVGTFVTWQCGHSRV